MMQELKISYSQNSSYMKLFTREQIKFLYQGTRKQNSEDYTVTC
jgi:hypothetical protein